MFPIFPTNFILSWEIGRNGKKRISYLSYLSYELKSYRGKFKKRKESFCVFFLTSTMRHPFHVRVYARADFQVFNFGLEYSVYRKSAWSCCDQESATVSVALQFRCLVSQHNLWFGGLAILWKETAASLSRLVKDEQLRKKMGQAGDQKYLEQLTLEKFEYNMLCCLKSALDNWIFCYSLCEIV